MRRMTQLFAITIFAAQRLWNYRLLMGCLLLGLWTAVGLLSSIPLYADAVQNRLLQGELTEGGTYRPPFAFLWRYVGAWHGDVTWAQYHPINRYLTEQAPAVIDLPLDEHLGGGQIIRHVSSSRLRLYPIATSSHSFTPDTPLIWTNIGFISDLQGQITLLEGQFPTPHAANDPAEILISHTLADQLGLQVGETYLLFASNEQSLNIRIAGVWRANNPADAFWFYQPGAFHEMLLTSEEIFQQQVVPVLAAPVGTAVWYQIYDGGHIRPASVNSLLERVAIAEARVTSLLNHTTLDASPVTALQGYGRTNRVLTLTLTIFSLPVVGLILYFITLVAGMVVARGQSEIAILRSRGATRGQIVAIYLLEGTLIGGLGLGGGLWLGARLAQLMGRTRTFLDPAILTPSVERELLPVLSPTAINYGLVGVALALLALLVPAFLSSRYTIVTVRWEQARALLAPLWQRYFLDIGLLLLPLYGWYQLEQQGNIGVLGSSNDPFTNPLLFLVPFLFCFSLALVAIRFFPLLMRGLAWLAAWLPGVTLLLMVRQLARSSAQYTGPLLLLSLTLSLATFTASMALTFDNHLYDQVYYQVGADLNLAELGEAIAEDEEATTGASSANSVLAPEPRWLFLPVTDHLLIPGVTAAARVGSYSATSNIGGRQQSGTILGIDRGDFPQVAFFRDDFAAQESLGGLMNRLALQPDHLLVSRDFLLRNSLQVGDPLRLTISTSGEFGELSFTIAGAIDLFPTQYPQNGSFFVGHLDHIHDGLGGTFPYNVWVQTDGTATAVDIVSHARQLGFTIVTHRYAPDLITAEQLRPERQGLFGLLSVGFLATAILTVLGFLVYAIVSFRRRFIQLGMLRAMGLSVGQMAAYLAGEQAALILTGVGIGTGLGVWASRLFIPFLQIGSGPQALIPPFIVQLAWQQLGTIYALFGGMMVLAVLILILLLIRMRIFEAVKLGEAV